VKTNVTHDVLSGNLAALGRANPALREALAHAPTGTLDLIETNDGGVTADWNGRRLASKHQPLEEAQRLFSEVDLGEVATVAVVGFGLGMHVEILARRLKKSGIVIVYEPDVALLKAVLSSIDVRDWVEDANVLFVTEGNDRNGLLERLAGMDAILMLGLRILEHPPSRPRLADSAPTFTRMIADFASTARMNVVTTLGRSAHTVANVLANIEGYALGASVSPLKDIGSGRLGIVVSAGPSLRRNVHLLAEPGVREGTVIIATQTTLRPLLDLGIKPHIVAALDYHEISTRFYEGLSAEDVEDTQLIIDPKVNPAVPAAWPGVVRSIHSQQLDEFLGPLARGGEAFPACSTVAHLAYALARYFGCNPVALIGQDLGFTDGLYYAPGTAIHNVWLPELNLFNTIETMEWERIVRHRGQLERREDINGRTIYTDEQMLTYLQQFEALFHADNQLGLKTIDASEGGVRKEGAVVQPLAAALDAHQGNRNPIVWPHVAPLEGSNRAALLEQLASVHDDAHAIKEASSSAGNVLSAMLGVQGDGVAMETLFEKLEAPRAIVAERADAFHLVDMVNQAGVFNRLRADRKLACAESMDAVEIQRAQLHRDRANVSWTADAAEELCAMLKESIESIRNGEPIISQRNRVATLERAAGLAEGAVEDVRIAAVLPVDVERGGTGVGRDLFAPFGASTVLGETVRRLSESKELAAVVLLVQERDREQVARAVGGINDGVDVQLVMCTEEIFGREHDAIRVARACASSSWRGALGGLTVYDEVFAPKATAAALEAGSFDGVLLVGPDWARLPVAGANGVDAVVRRFREQPRLGCTFNQAPPGVGGLVLATSIVQNYAEQRVRHASIGHLLGYRPERPEHDLIARDHNVTIDPSLRSAPHRMVVEVVGESVCGFDEPLDDVLAEAEAAARVGNAAQPPRLLTVELCTGRSFAGIAHRSGHGECQRPPMSEATFRSIVHEAALRNDVILTLDGAGDPLRHPAFDAFIEIARTVGIQTIHVRTFLDGERDSVERLLAAKPDIISVDLDGDTAEGRHAMHGVDHWDRIIGNMEFLIEHRTRLGSNDLAAFALPWIVPRLQRREASLEALPSFFERWRRRLGAAVIDAAPACNPDESIASTTTPERYLAHEAGRSMTVLCDGTVPLRCNDFLGHEGVGSVHDDSLMTVWRALLHARSRVGKDGAV
jgi:hypothetical protein